MEAKVLHGEVVNGAGDAHNWGFDAIRCLTGRNNLHKGTINVKLNAPHKVRPDFTLLRAHRTDRPYEDLYFECCFLITEDQRRVHALIARTSTNFHGDCVLEVITEWLDGIQAGMSIDVEVISDGVGPNCSP